MDFSIQNNMQKSPTTKGTICVSCYDVFNGVEQFKIPTFKKTTVCSTCCGEPRTSTCLGCKGNPVKNEQVSTQVKLLRGNTNKITLINDGDQNSGYLPGDREFGIIITRSLDPLDQDHSVLWEAKDNELVMRKKIALAHCFDKCRFVLQTLDRNVKISPKNCLNGKVIYDGKEMFIKNRGFPSYFSGSTSGDLKVIFEVVFPKHISLVTQKELGNLTNFFYTLKKLNVPFKQQQTKQQAILIDLINNECPKGEFKDYPVQNFPDVDNANMKFIKGWYEFAGFFDKLFRKY